MAEKNTATRNGRADGSDLARSDLALPGGFECGVLDTRSCTGTCENVRMPVMICKT